MIPPHPTLARVGLLDADAFGSVRLDSLEMKAALIGAPLWQPCLPGGAIQSVAQYSDALSSISVCA